MVYRRKQKSALSVYILKYHRKVGVDRMLLTIRARNSRNRNSILFILLTFILLIIALLHRERTRRLSYTPTSHDITQWHPGHDTENLSGIHQPLSSTILRGILVYYPHDQEDYFLPELFWLYRSWLEMMKDEPFQWRTDLVIYSEQYTSNLQKLGCLYNRIRINQDELPVCRVFPYQRVFSRGIENNNSSDHLHKQIDSTRSTLLTIHLKNYEYIDSINIITECYPSFAMYNYILRTDMDVFLTKNFGHFVPFQDIFLVGKGGYSTNFNSARLVRVAKDLEWSDANLRNIGSTWYGSPHTAQLIANFSLDAMIHLAQYEFTDVERTRKLGTLLWPDWHYGVICLYGAHLAINHLMVAKKLRVKKADDLLDQFTTGTDRYDIEKNNRLHLHSWHGEQVFSKFHFKAGGYDRIRINRFIGDTSAAIYALRMAVESRVMSFDGLKEGLLNAKKSSTV